MVIKPTLASIVFISADERKLKRQWSGTPINIAGGVKFSIHTLNGDKILCCVPVTEST